MKLYKMVYDIQKKFGLHYNGPPRYLSESEQQFRIDGMKEELQEYIDAVNLEDQFDSLLDLQVFVCLAMQAHGFPVEEGFKRVCEANANKEVGKNVKRRNYALDLVKPKDWEPPNHSDLLYPTGILILDGPDGSGKSTLAKMLNDKYNGCSMHATWTREWDGKMDHYLDSIFREAIKLAEDRLVVLDRHWMSPFVYSQVHKQAGVSDFGWYTKIHKEIETHKVKTVVCLPTREWYIPFFRELRESRDEMFNTGEMQVYDLYHEILLSESSNPDVRRYTMDLHTTSMPTFCNEIRKWVQS